MLKQSLIFVLLTVVVTMMAAQCTTPSAQESVPSAGPGDAPKIVVMEPWSRPSPLVAGNGAVYMTLKNEGGSADVLLGAETGVAEVVELHESKLEGDVMMMGPVSGIEVPAGGSAKLEPGGLHVMLINLQQELTPGQKITLTLQFEKSGPMTIEAEVRESGGD